MSDYQYVTTEPVRVSPGDEFEWGICGDGKPFFRNVSALRRRQIDDAVRTAARNVWPGHQNPVSRFLGSVIEAAEEHPIFLSFFANHVRQIWRLNQ